MALAKIVKINLIAQQAFQDQILKRLQELGSLEVIGTDIEQDTKAQLSETASKLDYQIAGVNFSLDFLASHDTAKKSFLEKIDSSIRMNIYQVEKIATEFDHESVVKKVQDLESQINEKNNQHDKIAAEILELTPWKDLSFVPSKDTLPKNYLVKFFSASQAVARAFDEHIKAKIPFAAIEHVSAESAKEVYAVIVYRQDQESKINELIATHQLKMYDLPEVSVRLPRHLENLAEQTIIVERQIEKLESQAKQHLDYS